MRMFLLVITAILTLASSAFAATTYYVATTGTGTNCTEAQNIATPHNTIAEGLGCLAAGDTLYIRAGTYTGSSSQITAASIGATGTVNSRIWIGRYQSETVTIAPGSNLRWGVQLSSARNYITIDGIIFDCTSTATVAQSTSCVLMNSSAATGIIFQNNTFKNSPGNGMLLRLNDSQILNNRVTNNGLDPAYANSNGIYAEAVVNSVLRGNVVDANEAGGIRVYNSSATGTSSTGNIIERNITHSQVAGIIIADQNNTVRYNISYNNSSYGIWFYSGTSEGSSGHVAYHNLAYNNGVGIQIDGTVSGTIVKNNLVTGNSGVEIVNGGSGSTITHNACTSAENCGSTGKVEIAALTDCTVSTSDFTHKSGSSCIDVGTSISGLSFNVAPDIGPFETAVGTSGTVTGNTLRLQVDMNLNTPLVVGALAGYSVNNGRTVTNVALVGSSAVDLTFDGSACTNLETWTGTYNASTGTATDSALVGGTLNQKILSFGPITVTNNCSGASYLLTQTKGAIYSALGSQATTLAITDVKPSGLAAIRTKWKATLADPPALTSKLQVSCNGAEGSYADLANTFGACNIRYVGLGSFTGMDGHTTTISDERLTSEFSGMTNGAVVRCATGCEIPSVDLAQDAETEQVDIIEVDSDATTGTVYHFRRVLVDNTTLTYAANSKPSLQVVPPGAVGGF